VVVLIVLPHVLVLVGDRILLLVPARKILRVVVVLLLLMLLQLQLQVLARARLLLMVLVDTLV
jgi:hypothetical protein